MKKPTLKHRPHLEALFPYPAGKPIEEVQREFGISSVVKLASNENPLGPSPKAVAAAKRALAEVNYYPEGSVYYLRQALARKLRVKPEQLVFGNGTDELIVLLALTFLAPGENIVVSDKAFIRYQMAAMLVDARFKSVPMAYSEPGRGQICWRHDLPALARAIDKNTRMVCLSNPNNPIGTGVTRDELEAFLKRVPRRVLVLCDEAYYEYARGRRGYPNGLKYLKDYPNLVVTRTFSKAYGLAGLRVGYGVAHPEVVQSVERVRPPFNVNRVAQAAALAALEDKEHLRRSIENNRAGLDYLARELIALGYQVIPSWANFVTFDIGGDAVALCQALLREGVIVRPLAGFKMPSLIRATVGKPAENRRLIRALKKTGSRV